MEEKRTEEGRELIKKHPGGRPTKYTPDIWPKIEEYISMCSRENTQMPTIEGLAIHLDVNPETVYRWAKKYPKFSKTIKKITARQKVQLMNDGMYGGKEVNAAMAIFLLKVNHHMQESPTTLQQFNIGGNMSIEFIGDESKTIPLATESSERRPQVQGDMRREKVGKVGTSKINFAQVGS